MTNVRLKGLNQNIKIITIICIIISVVIIVILTYQDLICKISDKIDDMKNKSINKTPYYESLKDINFSLNKNSRFNLPISNGTYEINEEGSMIIYGSPKSSIKSIDNGMISNIGYDNYLGNYIEVIYSKLNKEEIYVLYGLLDNPITNDIITVQKNQKIGGVGTRGYIYFEIRDKNHTLLNPYEYMNLK